MCSYGSVEEETLTPSADHAGQGSVEALATERLEAEITTLAGHIAAATCRWLLLVAEFDRREAWGGWGCRSCAHWLSWQCGHGAAGGARARPRCTCTRRAAGN